MNNLWKAGVPARLAVCLAGALALASCGRTPDSSPTTAASDATGDASGAVAVSGPDAKPGISVSEGKLVLPVIPGRPAAVYFKVRNGGPGKAVLAGVDVTGAAKAEMHKTDGTMMSSVKELQLEPGAEVDFAAGGLHVMVFDLDPKLKAGGTTELTLTFADGDKASLPLAITTMGAAGDTGGHDMAGHDMSGHDMSDMPGMAH